MVYCRCITINNKNIKLDNKLKYIINRNSKKVAFKKFKYAYEILNNIKTDYLTTEDAEIIIRAFEICYEFILKVMEVKLGEEVSTVSLPKYLLIMAAKYNLIDNLEMWMIFYDIKDKLARKQDTFCKGKIVFNIIKILPIFKMKVDELMRLFEVKNKLIVK